MRVFGVMQGASLTGVCMVFVPVSRGSRCDHSNRLGRTLTLQPDVSFGSQEGGPNSTQKEKDCAKPLGDNEAA